MESDEPATRLVRGALRNDKEGMVPHPTPAGRTAELAELAHAMLADHDLPVTPHYLQLFGRVYRHFLETVPAHQRSSERLADIFRASVGLPSPRSGHSEPSADLQQEVQRLTGVVAELESQARAWEAERLALEAGAKHGRTVIANLYEELAAQLAAEQRLLAEREAALRRQEEELNRRLAEVERAERDLLPRLAAAERPEMEAVLALEVEALRGELAQVAGELSEVQAELAQLDSDDGGSPLVAAVRRLKEEAAAAGIDALTGLAGRDLFERDLGHALAASQRRRKSGRGPGVVTAVFVDLDGFKGVNDNHGHPTGDALLRAVAQTFHDLLRESDRAYRLGGDEFILLLTDTDATGAARVAEAVRDAIRALRVTTCDGAEVQVTASLGVADTATAGLALVQCADLALYQAKKAGGDRIATYRDDAFVEPLPPGVASSFLEEVRRRLARGDAITMAAVHPDKGQLGPLRDQLRDLFPEARAEECGEEILLLIEGTSAEQAAATIAEGIHGISATAGATDLSEIPPEDGASPAGRLAALINTPLALARDAAS